MPTREAKDQSLTPFGLAQKKNKLPPPASEKMSKSLIQQRYLGGREHLSPSGETGKSLFQHAEKKQGGGEKTPRPTFLGNPSFWGIPV